DVLGTEQAKKYYQGLRHNAIQLAPGNKQVAEWVGRGRSPTGTPVTVGITDTDDALEEVKRGRPVVIVFPDGDGKTAGRMGTLFIPNTLAVLKGCPNPDAARRLVDYLLDPATEAALAQGNS